MSTASPVSDPTAGVLAAVAAINAELSSPVASAQVTAAMQRLAAVQSLATALNDAVVDLRGHATTHLAAVGAAAAQLIASGDVAKWRETIEALDLVTRSAQLRFDALLELAHRTSAPPAPPSKP